MIRVYVARGVRTLSEMREYAQSNQPVAEYHMSQLLDTALSEAAHLRDMGDVSQASWIVTRLLNQHPTDIRVWHAAALCAAAGHDWQSAKKLLESIHEAAPTTPGLAYQLGIACERLGQYEAGVTWYREAATVAQQGGRLGDRAMALASQAACLARLGEHDTARIVEDQALRFSLSKPGAQFALSHLRLARGDYAQGWVDAEARLELNDWRAMQARGHGLRWDELPPMWDGRQPGRVLCYAEQGSGDTIWSLRYLPEIAARSGERPIVVCQPSLVTLVAYPMGPYVADVLPNGSTTKQDVDYSLPLMSAPYALCMFDPRPPANNALQWRLPDPPNAPARVGVCWRGEPMHGNDRDRSCPESLMPYVTAIPGVEAVSLQHGQPRVFASYYETAKLMLTLDAVLTVDTSVAHLAGTLGVPTYCLVPTSPEWRWRDTDGIADWYPSVRVIRRRASAEWRPAIEEAVARITREIAPDGGRTGSEAHSSDHPLPRLP